MKTTIIIILLLIVSIFIFDTMFGAKSDNIELLGAPEKIISGDKKYVSPRFSPDGKYLSLSTSGYNGIYLYSFESGEIIELTQEPGAGYMSKWSHDSKNISFRTRSTGRERTNFIKAVNIQTGNVNVIHETKERIGMPFWSNNGEFVNFSKGDEVITLNKNGFTKQADRQLEDAGILILPATFITYSKTGESFEFNLDDENVLTSNWSKNKQRIVFETAGSNIFSINPDGTEKILLESGERPKWSPNQEWVVYMKPVDDGHRILGSDIYVVKKDGSKTLMITDTPDIIEFNPDWSPNGDAIVYEAHDTGDIYLQKIKY